MTNGMCYLICLTLIAALTVALPVVGIATLVGAAHVVWKTRAAA
ncbi:hypothetical protein [Amycolatopsis antarctica]|nr:hypothetical protein [Amycolatopsis antarctica]